MGAAPDRRIPDERSHGQAFARTSTNQMGSSESPKISLVNTAHKASAWNRSLFNLDSGFKGLMLLAALTVLAVLRLILADLLQRPPLPLQKFELHLFRARSWDPVAGEFGALPFPLGTNI